MGCPQTAKAVVGEKREGDGPPPPISKKVIFGAVALIAILITVSALWPTPPDPALGRTKIVFLGEADYILQEAMTSIAAEFNGASEEIYLDLQLLPPATLEQKLLVLVAAGQAPDIAIVSEQQFPFLRDEGALLALGENKAGEAVYHLEHPALRGKIIVWGSTEHPEAARAVLDYLIPRLPIKGS